MAQAKAGQPLAQLYTRTARVLHWVTVALVAVQIPVGLYMT